MIKFSAELDPSCEYLTESLESLLAGGAVCGRTGTVRVLRPPSRLRAIIIEDFFDGGTGERGVEPLV